MGTENNYTKNASPSFQSDSSIKLSKTFVNKSLPNNCVASNTNNHHSSSNKVQVSSTVPHLPIEINENFVIEGAIEVLKVIRPSWDLDFVQFKVRACKYTYIFIHKYILICICVCAYKINVHVYRMTMNCLFIIFKTFLIQFYNKLYQLRF